MPSPYIPNTEAEKAEMLRRIGADSAAELFQNIPAKFRDTHFNLPSPLSELELKEELARLASRNANIEDYACFLGAGSYRHFIPSVIGHITGRSEFYTAYTPYQAEASQGTLQAIYEYQSLVSELTGMEVSNAGMYDGGTATAEAALMACRITDRDKVAIVNAMNQRYTEVVRTYISGRNIIMDTVDSKTLSLSPDCACLVTQQPNFYGYFDDLNAAVRQVHNVGALLIVVVDPISLGLFRPPGDYGADIVVAEGQPLGNPTSFGGPGLGILTCRESYLRQMPGRLVSRTTDTTGQLGYVLTLQTREQHIRREHATSNICTNEALVALATTVYLSALGKTGLRRVAELCYHKAHYAARKIAKLNGYSLVFPEPFFKEFVVRCPGTPHEINENLFQDKIIGGFDLNETIENGMLLCVTEMNTRPQIDKLVTALGRYGGS
jgi:glycine dehydrogenase subunit 1